MRACPLPISRHWEVPGMARPLGMEAPVDRVLPPLAWQAPPSTSTTTTLRITTITTTIAMRTFTRVNPRSALPSYFSLFPLLLLLHPFPLFLLLCLLLLPLPLPRLRRPLFLLPYYRRSINNSNSTTYSVSRVPRRLSLRSSVEPHFRKSKPRKPASVLCCSLGPLLPSFFNHRSNNSCRICRHNNNNYNSSLHSCSRFHQRRRRHRFPPRLLPPPPSFKRSSNPNHNTHHHHHHHNKLFRNIITCRSCLH